MVVVFFGTPHFAVPTLRRLLDSSHSVAGVITQPDRPRGRGQKITHAPVKALALARGIPVYQPDRLKPPEVADTLRGWQADLGVVAAYGRIIPEHLLTIPRLGMINVHASLLPKYRGAAPIQWAILNGDPETGVTIMKMNAGMDTGDIVSQQTIPIAAADNSETLYERLARSGADLLVKTIPDYTAGKIQPRPQPDTGVSHAPKIKKEDGRLDWNQPARVLWNRTRAMTPWPGAFTHISGPQPQLLKIWATEVVTRSGQPGEILQADKTGIVVGCGTDALRILTLQREGGRRMSAQEFLAGHALRPGQRFD